jgi:hypothetical protein
MTSEEAYSVVDSLGLLDHNQVLGGSLERVREGRLGAIKAAQRQLAQFRTQRGGR